MRRPLFVFVSFQCPPYLRLKKRIREGFAGACGGRLVDACALLSSTLDLLLVVLQQHLCLIPHGRFLLSYPGNCCNSYRSFGYFLM